MANMQTFSVLLTIFSFIFLTAAANDDRRIENNGRYNPQYQNPYYNNRYYKNNREYYNNRQYYDGRFKNYNPNISSGQARILDQEMKTPEDGTYSYSYETDNGIHAEEHGVSMQVGKDEQKKVVQGSYSFVTPEGVQVLVRYTADENGFHPVITYGGVDGAQYASRAQPADVGITKPN